VLGATVSHYQINGRLGFGGMGDVYSARDTLLGRIVAIKVLQSSATSSDTRRQRFLQEARAASALNHPAIVTIYDVVREGNDDYIVMELVEGETLGDRIALRPMTVSQTLDLLRQVASGLAVAHARGIVHRDLKPGNIMLPASGGVKILDFGLAKVTDRRSISEDQPTSPRTASGEIFGTLEYMSPEQVMGQPVDARSDIFSLGTIAFEMLTGRRPFHSDSVAATLHAIAYNEPPSVESLRDDVPAGVRTLLQRMLAKRPEMRFADAGELLRAIELMQAGVDPTPPPRPRSRRPLVIAAIGAALIAIAAGAVMFRPGGSRGASAPPSTTRPSPAAAAPLPRTAREHVARGNELMKTYWRDGYVDQAIEQYQRAIALDTDSAPAHAALSLAYWRKYRDTDDAAVLNLALQNGRRAVELEPQLATAMVSLGVAEMEHGDTAEAQKRLQEALVLDPSNASAHRGLGVIASRGGRAAEAEKHFLEAIKHRPDDQQLHGDLGVLLYTNGRYDDAAKAFQKSIDLAPDNAAGYRNLGAVLHQKGDYPGAARALQQSLEIRPDPAVYSNLGTLYFFQGLYPQSVSAFEKAVAQGANDYIVWANLGDAYRWTPGNEQRAREAFTRALQLLEERLKAEPENGELRSRRALLLAKRGDRDLAMSVADPLARSTGQDANTLYRLALAYELAGARDRALTQLDRAIGSGYSTEELRKDPELIALRADVRYHRMMTRHE
jgi:serine/threonine protein kinase/Tfp pilus assembly protein PilF